MTNVTSEPTSTQKTWTIRSLLQATTQYLKGRGSPSARLDAELMLAQVLSYKRVQLYTEMDKPLSAGERGQYRDMVRRRGLGEPVAYIVGTRAFWKYDFEVNKHVLIPRPDTELIIEEVIEDCTKNSWLPQRILDVGSGSGCLAISLANEFKESSVVGWDISPEAIEVSERNGNKLGVSNVSFERVDALDDYSWVSERRFDLVVANPPYIAHSEQESLDRSVVNFEPHTALFAKEDGLAFYRKLAQYAKNILSDNSPIFLEVGLGQAPKVIQLFEEYGWTLSKLCLDLSGIERVLVFRSGGVMQ